jgi:hypothetical protein
MWYNGLPSKECRLEGKISGNYTRAAALEGTMNSFVVMDGPGFMKNGPKRG